jgi:hypothetical protein
MAHSVFWQDQRVLVTPVPGTDRDNLLRNLQHVRDGAINARNAGGAGTWPQDVYRSYAHWAQEAIRLLRRQISQADLEHLVQTPAYWAVMAQTAAGSTQLIDTELDARASVLEDACSDLNAQIIRWSRDGVFVVADTSFYIHYPEKIEDLDLRHTMEIREEPIVLLIPIIVIDELDNLKESKDKRTRWRAGYTLAVLDRVLTEPTGVGLLRQEDFSPLDVGGIPRGQVTVGIVFDRPGHSRLPIADDEIIDRALAIQTLAGKPVTMVTYDTGQSMRARAADLRVKNIPHEVIDAD